MRTLIGAADPPPRRPADAYSFTTVLGGGPSTTGHTVSSVVGAMMTALGYTVTPWQAVVVRQAYAEREPYRTVAFVTRHRAIERA
jgi:hypothetical protein